MKIRPEYVRTFTAALMADLSQDPTLAARVARGGLSPASLDQIVLASVARGVRGGRTPFRHVAGLVRSEMEFEKVARDSGVGAEAPVAAAAGSVWDAVGAAISGAATIASNVLTTKYKAEGDAAVAKLTAQSQSLSAQAAQLASQTQSASASGTPGWVLPVAATVGALVIGGVVWAMSRRR